MPPDKPLVTFLHDGNRQVVAATDNAAAALGLTTGTTLAHARAMISDLAAEPADLEGDAAALGEVAAWCLRYAPSTAASPPDCIWIDATGCAHLAGGEHEMLTAIADRFAAAGNAARLAIADTPGAAWAVAHHARTVVTVVAVGKVLGAISPLPVQALRLSEGMEVALGRLGFTRVHQLLAAPRAPLALRLGPTLMRRLDQASGRVFEPIVPVIPPETVAERLPFIEPLITAEAFVEVISRLTIGVCHQLEQRGEGARQLDLVFERVDGSRQIIRIGTARATRDARHIARMLDERVEGVDPGLGVDAMHLIVALTDRLSFVQSASLLAERDRNADTAVLVDRLISRLGADHVYRVAMQESDVPERGVRRVPALAPLTQTRPHPAYPRPTRLLNPPQLVEAMAELPDQPPRMFMWRRVRHRIRRADGPERIQGEWWRRDSEMRAIRDYWQVEDETGQRFWLYRSGDGVDTGTGNLSWFLHGFF